MEPWTPEATSATALRLGAEDVTLESTVGKGIEAVRWQRESVGKRGRERRERELPRGVAELSITAFMDFLCGLVRRLPEPTRDAESSDRMKRELYQVFLGLVGSSSHAEWSRWPGPAMAWT